MNVNREMLAFLRKQYPVGTRIRLDSMQDPYAPVEAGTTGKLDYIDDAGQFHMKWDNGRTLALIPGVDSFTVLPPELSMTKLYMPLTAELYEPDVYGNMQEEPELLTGHDLTAYEDNIRSALVKYRMPEETARGIMHWYDAADSVNDKVRSVTFDVERRNGKLPLLEEALLMIDEHCDIAARQVYDQDNKAWKAISNALKGRVVADDDQYSLGVCLLSRRSSEAECHIYVLPVQDAGDFFFLRSDQYPFSR